MDLSVEIRDLRKELGSVVAVDGVSLSVRKEVQSELRELQRQLGITDGEQGAVRGCYRRPASKPDLVSQENPSDV